MLDVLPLFAGWCGSVSKGPAGAGGLVLGLLLAGAAGSPMHCVPMCGVFVLGQMSDRMARMPLSHFGQCQRFRAAALAPYHLGRITTYAALGGLAGEGGAIVLGLGFPTGLLLIGAAVLLAARGLRPLALGFVPSPPPRTNGYVLGLTLGLLPCGLVYAALAAAAGFGSPLYGAIAMAAFGFGTVPALVVTALAGAAAGRWLNRGIATLAPAISLFNAVLLAALGLSLVLNN